MYSLCTTHALRTCIAAFYWRSDASCTLGKHAVPPDEQQEYVTMFNDTASDWVPQRSHQVPSAFASQ